MTNIVFDQVKRGKWGYMTNIYTEDIQQVDKKIVFVKL